MSTTIWIDLASFECWSPGCGAHFGMTQLAQRRFRENGRTFYCINGHPLAFGPSDADKLRDQLTREKHRTEQAEAEAKTLRRAVTKLKKRVSGGVCPCCNRTFENLARHMKGKHPTYAKAKP